MIEGECGNKWGYDNVGRYYCGEGILTTKEDYNCGGGTITVEGGTLQWGDYENVGAVTTEEGL